MLEAVIFDMDGVIVDSEPGYLIAMNEVLKPYGIYVDKRFNERFIGKASVEAWKIIRREVGITDMTTVQCVEAMEASRRRLIEKEGYRPIKGTIPLIQRLYKDGIKLAIASSNTREEIFCVMEELKIWSYFSCIVSGWDECTYSKPDPEVFEKAVEKLGMKKENCLIIEDSDNGARAGKTAGIKVLGFRNPEVGTQRLEDADYVVEDMQKVDVVLCRKVCEG